MYEFEEMMDAILMEQESKEVNIVSQLIWDINQQREGNNEKNTFKEMVGKVAHIFAETTVPKLMKLLGNCELKQILWNRAVVFIFFWP